MFQYNFCYCSIRIPPMPACLHGSFQYNFCYCSIGISTPISFAFLKFQYNFCYCSIIMLFIKVEIRLGFNTTFVTVLSPRIIQLLMECRVSIQLLLLFYCNWQAQHSYNNGVSIQLLLLFYPHFYWFLILLYHKISPKNQDFLNFLPT